MRSIRQARGAELGSPRGGTKRGAGGSCGTFRIFLGGTDREVDLGIDRVELRDKMIVIYASGKAPFDVHVQQGDLVSVIGQDGLPLFRCWIDIYSPLNARAGERISLNFPLSLGTVVNTSMIDHTLDVDL